VKALKRENKQLQQNRVEKKEPLQEDSEGGEDNIPPWERRKSAAKLLEFETIINEKNIQVERLRDDCGALEKQNEQYRDDLQLLTRQFEECSQQLQTAIQDISSLRTKNQGNLHCSKNNNNKPSYLCGILSS